eukprot:576514-Prorocentrum_minimum.AAC.3
MSNSLAKALTRLSFEDAASWHTRCQNVVGSQTLEAKTFLGDSLNDLRSRMFLTRGIFEVLIC